MIRECLIRLAETGEFETLFHYYRDFVYEVNIKCYGIVIYAIVCLWVCLGGFRPSISYVDRRYT